MYRGTRKKGQRGLSLTEMAVVIGIGGLVLGAIWVASRMATNSNINRQISRNTLTLMAGIQNIDITSPGAMNVGADGGCAATANTCPAPDPFVPTLYDTPTTQYCGTDTLGNAVCQNGSPYGLANVATTSPTTITHPMPAPCLASSPYYYTTGQISTSNLSGVAMDLGLVPADWVSPVGTISSPWGAVGLASLISGNNSCTAGGNGAIISSMEDGSSFSINGTTPGYTNGSLTFGGQSYIYFPQVPKSSCMSFLQSNTVNLMNQGLVKVCVSDASSPSCKYGATISSSSTMSAANLKMWCSSPATSTVTVLLYFHS